MKEEKEKELLQNEDIELQLLLEAIYLKYGYDFRAYSKAHMKRRVKQRLAISELGSISELQYQILYDPMFFRKILPDFSIHVTEMFRDPVFYKTIRTQVIPFLRAYPFIKIWHAGCSTGEEVYSMAILLKEEGLYDRVQIYATDFNEAVLETAKAGIYPASQAAAYKINYEKYEGRKSFTDYYIEKYDAIRMSSALRKNIVFADHNLVTDGVFGEMNLILCRNVFIYFTRELQNRVLKLFLDSLCPEGFLGLGMKESVEFSTYGELFETICGKTKIYKKKGD